MGWDWIKSCFNSRGWYARINYYGDKASYVIAPVLDDVERVINKVSTVWTQWGLQYSRIMQHQENKSLYNKQLEAVWDKYYKHLSKEKFEKLYVCRLVQASIVMRNTQIEYNLTPNNIFLEVDKKDQEVDDVARPKKEYYDRDNHSLLLGVNVLQKNVGRYRVDYVNDLLKKTYSVDYLVNSLKPYGVDYLFNSLKPYSVYYLLNSLKPESVNTTGEKKKLDTVNDLSYYIQSDREIKIQSVLYQPKQIGGVPNALLGVEGQEGQEGYED